MQSQRLPGQHGEVVELDFCFGCQGIWFDHQESLKLAPEAVTTVFKQMHEHSDAARTPLATKLACPQCRGGLAKGFDVVRSGRYITYRCEQRHGRFSSFAAFMIEKGFVRQLTRPEIAQIAQKIAVIHCSSCGAPVDLRREDTCSHCRSALSLLDPQAVEAALQRHAAAVAPATTDASKLGDLIVALERERARVQREKNAERHPTARVDALPGVSLFSVGLSVLSGLWND